LAGAGIRSRARCAPRGRDRSVGHGSDVTEGDGRDERTDMSRTARGGGYAVQAAGLARWFGGRTAVDRVDLPVPAGTAFGYLGARRRREDHADPDAAGAEGWDVRVGAAAGAPGPGRALGCAFAGGGDGRGAAVPDADLPDPDAALGAVEPPGGGRPRSCGFGSVRDSLSAPAPAGHAGCLSVTSSGIIPCISRAISARDEADGLPAVRFSRRGKSRVSGLSGGSLYPGLVLGAAFCCCTKSNAQAPVWAAYAESISGRRS
jgi:hypothetical protein